MYLVRRLEVENYRCLADRVVFEPDRVPTFVVGTNGTGKSSLLDALQLLADWAGRRMAPWTYRARFGWLPSDTHLSPGALLWDPSRPFSATVELAWNPHLEAPPGAPAGLRWSVSADARGHVLAERLEVLPEPDAEDWQAVLDRDARGSRAIDTTLADWRPLGPRTESLAVSHAADPELFHPGIHALYDHLQRVHTLRLHPAFLRTRGQLQPLDAPPDRYGRDLAGRLHAILTERRRCVDEWLEVLEGMAWWRELTVPVRDGAPTPQVVERGHDHAVPLRLASDGQLVFAYLAALAVAPPPSPWTLLIDEPAVGLSRGNQRDLELLLRKLSKHHQVILASHAMPLVDRTGRWDTVWVAHRDPGRGTRLKRLEEFRDSHGPFPDDLRPGVGAEEIVDLLRDEAEE